MHVLIRIDCVPTFLSILDECCVHLALLVSFSATIFVSAMLLFMVQPLVCKILLPYLGGTPAVWNTCMVFFYSLLLGGYYYAHRM